MSECELRYRRLQIPRPEWEDPPRDGPGREPRRQLGIQMVFEDDDVPVQWIWPGCFPRGNLSLIAGYPGVGKSFVPLDIAARLTIGRDWPDGTPAPSTDDPAFKDREHCNRAERRAVVLVSGDDALHSTIAQRFQGAGGDLERLLSIEHLTSRRNPDGNAAHHLLHFDRDIQHLANYLEEWIPVGLVIVDPLSAHCQGADPEGSINRLLLRLSRVAHDQEVAIIVISHLRRPHDACDLHRALGSRALAAVPQAIWSIDIDPDDPDRRLMRPLKMNLAGPPRCRRFRFGQDKLIWDGEPIRDAARTGVLDGTVLREATDFLRALLAFNDVPANEIIEQGRRLGFSARTLYRAKARLQISARREGFGPKGVQYWNRMEPSCRPPDSERSSVGKKRRFFGKGWTRDDRNPAGDEPCRNRPCIAKLAMHGAQRWQCMRNLAMHAARLAMDGRVAFRSRQRGGLSRERKATLSILGVSKLTEVRATSLVPHISSLTSRPSPGGLGLKAVLL